MIQSTADSQRPELSRIQLTPPSIERTASYAVWRTDYYICTGIAYAKSLGHTADDFATFVGNTHSLEGMKAQGLAPIVQLLYFVIKNYEGGEFETLSESDSSVKMRFNRPYARYFTSGPLIGVSLDEFEAYLWKHVAIMADHIGLDFVYRIEGNQIMATLSTRE